MKDKSIIYEPFLNYPKFNKKMRTKGTEKHGEKPMMILDLLDMSFKIFMINIFKKVEHNV